MRKSAPFIWKTSAFGRKWRSNRLVGILGAVRVNPRTPEAAAVVYKNSSLNEAPILHHTTSPTLQRTLPPPPGFQYWEFYVFIKSHEAFVSTG